TPHVMIEGGAEGWYQRFLAIGAVVHVIDPKQANNFAKSLKSSGAKDDNGDSEMLAQMGSSPLHISPAWKPETDLSQQIEILGSGHDVATTEMVRAEQRIRAILREHMPILDSAITDISFAWVAALLRKAGTPWHAKRLSKTQFEAIMSTYRTRQETR